MKVEKENWIFGIRSSSIRRVRVSLSVETENGNINDIHFVSVKSKGENELVDSIKLDYIHLVAREDRYQKPNRG